MKFQVLNRKNAKAFSFQNHDYKTAIISITDVDKIGVIFSDNPNNGIRAILRLKFDDVEKNFARNENCITREDGEAIVNFVNKNKNKVDKFIVHCEAGVSRSAGVCAAIMKAINGDDWDIFNNPRFCPNMTCYRTVLDAFDKAGYFDEDPEKRLKLKKKLILLNGKNLMRLING